MAEPLTTTFCELYKYGACQRSYRKLARALGGVKAYGRDTPIPVSRIVDTNGIADALWVLERPWATQRRRDVYSGFFRMIKGSYATSADVELLKGLCDGTIE